MTKKDTKEEMEELVKVLGIEEAPFSAKVRILKDPSGQLSIKIPKSIALTAQINSEVDRIELTVETFPLEDKPAKLKGVLIRG